MNAQLQPEFPQPRLGFLGVGWIGRHRMQVLAESGAGVVAAVCDSSEDAVAAARAAYPAADVCADLDAMLQRQDLDGLVIATPSAAHASQAISALERGLAVFCQKPLARTAAEAETVLQTARRVDRLVGVDFSYRHLAGVAQLRDVIRGGELGQLHAIDLTFHNAYGPDKDWFYDLSLAGGGCVMDLAVHLLDLALWMTDFPPVSEVDARLLARGRRLSRPIAEVEDYAAVQMRLADAIELRMSTSWRLPAGCDAVIEAAFYGSGGGAAIRNVAGSFYDFTVERFHGTAREQLAAPPDAWGGRALIEWSRALADNPGYDPRADRLLDVARCVDRIYGR